MKIKDLKNKKKRDEAAQFCKNALKYYLSIYMTFIPKTTYYTFFSPRKDHKEYIEISKRWLGQELKCEIYELAHRKERQEYLDQMLQEGFLNDEEYKKCLSK